MKRIAIIGFGAAGVACFNALIKHAKKNQLKLLIDIYQPSKGFACGLSYQKDADYICLNHHHDFICLDMDEPRGFTKWLKENRPDYLEKFQGYQPRSVFSEFMYDTFLKLCQSYDPKPQVIHKEVISIKRYENKYHLVCVDQENDYDKVIIAMGHPEQENMYGLTGERYIHSPYPTTDKLTSIPANDTVAIIGMGLSAVDCVVSLSKQGHQGKILLVSKSGNFSAKRATPAPYESRYFTSNFVDTVVSKKKKRLPLIAAALNRELKLASTISIRDLFFTDQLSEKLQQDFNWQNILYSCNEQTEKAWAALSFEEREIFFKNYYKRWLDRRVGVAPHNYELLMQLKKNGQLTFMGGLKAIEQGFVLHLNKELHAANWVINATGSPRFLTNNKVPLIAELVSAKLARYHEFGGIDVTFKTSELLNESRDVQQGLYAIAHITSGVFFYTPIMDHIVKHADKIARHIVQN